MGEFDLIAKIRARASTVRRDDVIVGIGDDAALLQVPPGRQLVVTMDTLNGGVHFPVETAPADIGWKSLAVNLSDLAAMAAAPAWCTLSLSMPQDDAGWVDAFLDGFLALAAQHGIALVGGDTTRGPLSIGVTAHGFVEPERALRRDGAKAGDDVWVTGTLGDAAGALAQWRAGGAIDAALRERLDRPTPRIAIGRALRDVAHACIDVSDGLLADLGHVAMASGVGARIALDALPVSTALRAMFDDTARRMLQTSGGDDYELCFTAPPGERDAIVRSSAAHATPATHIGSIVDGSGVHAFTADDSEWTPPVTGYVHFADAARHSR